MKKEEKRYTATYRVYFLGEYVSDYEMTISGANASEARETAKLYANALAIRNGSGRNWAFILADMHRIAAYC